MNIKYQKYGIMCLLSILNITLISTFLKYDRYWYAFFSFLSVASLINSSSAISILFYETFKDKKKIIYRFEPKNYLYVVPCYNESEDELKKSLTSLVNQKHNTYDNRAIFIICDGKVTGNDNTTSTDVILKQILNINEIGDYYEYETWDSTNNIITIHKGVFLGVNFILGIKNTNYGKRDSLVLVRKLCYLYNFIDSSDHIKTIDLYNINNTLYTDMYKIFQNIYHTKIDYIVGIDADTVFDYNCTYELINTIESNGPNVYGCVGYVDISPKMKKYSPFILYQYAEYVFAQCLRRYAQSKITRKVNCLSGCNQILRVTEETCGHKILSAFNYLPRDDENIFNQIRSYASEDRNHVCLMLSMYPYVKTIQAINANAYTSVPTSVEVFASQRRRWNLGTLCNDMLLIYLHGINIFERIASFTNVLTFITSPFILIATIKFVISLVSHPSMTMLYLSISMIIPIIYAILIPIFIKKIPLKNTIYYYISFLFYLIFGSFIKLATYFYSIYYMDSINWGKTRLILKTADLEEDVEIISNNNYIEVESYTQTTSNQNNDSNESNEGSINSESNIENESIKVNVESSIESNLENVSFINSIESESESESESETVESNIENVSFLSSVVNSETETVESNLENVSFLSSVVDSETETETVESNMENVSFLISVDSEPETFEDTIITSFTSIDNQCNKFFLSDTESYISIASNDIMNTNNSE
jgi:chitin synthase